MSDNGSYNTSQPDVSNLDNPQQLEPEQIIYNSFKTAAIAVTKIYKESQKLKNQSLREGYEQCLSDIWSYATAVAEKRSSLNEDVDLYAFNGQHRLTVEVTDLLSALSRRLSSIDTFRNKQQQQQQPRFNTTPDFQQQNLKNSFQKYSNISTLNNNFNSEFMDMGATLINENCVPHSNDHKSPTHFNHGYHTHQQLKKRKIPSPFFLDSSQYDSQEHKLPR